MWFSQGGDPDRIAAAVDRFPARRHGDLWSGVGLGSSYAGGVERPTLETMQAKAHGYAAHLAQGAAFAAKARQRAGNPAPHTALACAVYCRMTADQAAAVTDECLLDLPADGMEPAYKAWRTRIRQQITSHLQRVECGVQS